MTLNYETPQKKPPRRYALWGTIIGAASVLGALVAVVFVGNDGGLACFWPFAVLIGAGLGWVAGTVIRALVGRGRE